MLTQERFDDPHASDVLAGIEIFCDPLFAASASGSRNDESGQADCVELWQALHVPRRGQSFAPSRRAPVEGQAHGHLDLAAKAGLPSRKHDRQQWRDQARRTRRPLDILAPALCALAFVKALQQIKRKLRRRVARTGRRQHACQ